MGFNHPITISLPALTSIIKSPAPWKLHKSCFCSFLSVTSHAQVLHATAIKNSSGQSLATSNYLMSLYVKDSDFGRARQLFDEMPERDVKSWTILISCFARHSFYSDALHCFSRMLSEGVVVPNEFTFSSVLKCCAGITQGLRIGKAIHGWIYRSAVDVLDVTLDNAVLDLYVKCRAFRDAKTVFELMDEKNAVSWNIMMAANLETGDVYRCIEFFRRMPVKDVSSWNTIIDGALQCGVERIALELLYEMAQDGTDFDKRTFSISFVLASSLKCLELGRQIHGRVVRMGINEDAFIRTSLIDMYCKCGLMEKASIIFQDLRQHTSRIQHFRISPDGVIAESVSWSTMIAGYVQNGMLKEALDSFRSMIHEEVEVNMITLTSIVTAAANAGLLELGQQIHARTLKCGQKPDVFLSSSMIDMYAKCGKLDDASSFFEQSQTRNVVLWTTMISSYAIHGLGGKAVWLFDLMQNEGISPNEVTFLTVLTACSHAGLVKEGCEYFRMMKDDYGLTPGVEHFTCMIDMFGRAGRLDEIKEFIYRNDISHLSGVWTAFLSSCWLQKDIEMAKWVSKKLPDLEPYGAGPYILLSNACSANQSWEEAAKLRGFMNEMNIKKIPAHSWTA